MTESAHIYIGSTARKSSPSMSLPKYLEKTHPGHVHAESLNNVDRILRAERNPLQSTEFSFRDSSCLI